ncbi:MAG: hypothetical protein AAGA65_12250 [Actinomycetota bacterium]
MPACQSAPRFRPIPTVVMFCGLLVTAACADDRDGGGDRARTADLDENVAAIVDDLNGYWSEASSDLGFEFEPVGLDRVSTGRDGVLCDRRPIEPSEVTGNAFVDSSCAEGITVAYDPDYLGGSLVRSEATLAHEWGHVVQAQATELDLSLDPDGLPIDAELQADCFAGAWAGERAASAIEQLRRDTAGAGDEGEVDIEDPHAHGSPEQRVAAFDVGLDGGPQACVDELIDALPE